MADRFSFFESFYDALCDFGDDDRLQLYDALMEFAFNGVEPEFTGFKATVWKLIRPNVEKSVKRSQTNSANPSKNDRATNGKTPDSDTKNERAQHGKTDEKTNRDASENKRATVAETNPSKEKENGVGTDMDTEGVRPMDERTPSVEPLTGGADADGSAPPDAACPTCPLCASRMTFDPIAGAWRCTVCGVDAEPRWS